MSPDQKQLLDDLTSTELSKSISDSAQNAVETCLSATSKDRAVVVFDQSTKLIAAALLKAFLKIGTQVSLFNVDLMGTRPLTRFPGVILQALKDATCSTYSVKSMRGELSVRRTLLESVKALKIRHAHMPSVTPQVFEDGLAMDYKKVSRFIKSLVAILVKANTVTVTTPAGTHLEFSFQTTPGYRILDGLIQSEQWQNLPSGQLLVYPQNADGQFVADRSLGDWFEHKYNIPEYPVTFEIENGYVRSIKCSNRKLERELWLFLTSSENSRRISELIIGANLGLTQNHTNALFDGYKPGASISFGAINPVPGTQWTSATFLPSASEKNSIFINDRQIMMDNAFCLDLFDSPLKKQ